MSEYFQADPKILPRRVSRSWRWRRCPACHQVERAGKFVAVVYGPSWENGQILRRCPLCGHRGRTATFQVVRERHP